VSLAIVSIYFATIFLLSDFKASIFVLGCVFITLTNVSGIMHFWGEHMF
jgi:K+ transporter